ncbi:MAG: lipid II flippase MurJ [Terrisporobacter sp.]
MMAFLQVKENFIIPGLMSVPYNTLQHVLCKLLSVKTTPYILPYGALIGLLGQFLFQLPFAMKRGYRYIPYINFKDEYLKRCFG